MKTSRDLVLAAVFGSVVMVGGALANGTAQAAQDGTSGNIRVAQNIELNVFGGQQYCWYDDAWQGPGWYWCGHAWRTGYGWGGGYGWRGGHAGGGHSGGGRYGGYSSGGGGHVGASARVGVSSRSSAGGRSSVGSRSGGGRPPPVIPAAVIRAATYLTSRQSARNGAASTCSARGVVDLKSITVHAGIARNSMGRSRILF
jgi:hypothetical protein